MLTQVDISNCQGSALYLPINDPSVGFIVREIAGLDPVNATISSTDFAQMDGAQYNSSKREKRNIRLTLELKPDYVMTSVRDLRKRLYGYAMPKSSICLTFHMSDGLIVEIDGIVESFTSALFSKEPAVDISVICFDPDFVETTSITTHGFTTSGTVETTLSYDGDIETGIEFTLHIDRVLSELTIYFTRPDGTLGTMDISYSFQAGDVLKMNTNRGKKAITLTRSSSDSSILYALSPQSSWMELITGDTKFRPYATGAAMAYDLTYTSRYGGL